MALLRKVGDAEGQFIDVVEPETILGRAPDCHIVLSSSGVSRQHAFIRKKNGLFILVDNNSRNFTFLHNEKLSPFAEYPLRQNDRVKICDVEFIFYERKPVLTGPEVKITPDSAGSTLHTLDASQSSSAMMLKVRPEDKLKAILEITRKLSSAIKIDAVAPKIVESLFSIFPQAERGLVVLKEEGSDRLVIKASKQRLVRSRSLAPGAGPVGADMEEASVSISRTIVNMVLGEKRAVLTQDAGGLPTSASIAEMRIQSVMSVPILTPDNRALGFIQLDTSHSKQFGNDDLDILTAVAGQAAIAINNAQLLEKQMRTEIIERQLKIAAEVQSSMLPRRTPKARGWGFFAHYDATYAVGGDFYDFVHLPDGRLAIALGDVSGKGIGAALIMAKFCGDNRTFVLTEGKPAEAAARLNEQFLNSGIEEKFITLSLSFLDPTTSRLTFCSAGHMPLLVRRANGAVEELGADACGLPIGVDFEAAYREFEIELALGEVVVVYSDGVTDARNGNGENYQTVENQRLFKRLRELPGTPEGVGKGLVQTLREFSAGQPQADDITIVCFGRIE